MATKLRRIIKTALSNFFRNGWLSLTATLIMTLAVLFVGVFLTVALSANRIVEDLKNKVDIIINFKDSASEAMIQQVRSDLLVRPGIKSVRFISKEDALAEFKSRPTVKDDIKAILTPEDNPLPRGLQIQSVELNEYQYVSDLLKNPTYAPLVDSSTYDDNKLVIQNIDNMSRFVERFGLGLSIFFILISVLVVFNTVRLAVLFREKEIEVMRLVGASESFIKFPFLIEGFLYGFFGVVIATVLLYLGVNLVSTISQNSSFASFVSRMVPVYYQEFWFIVLIQLIVGAVIGVGASWLSLRRNAKI